MAPRACVQDQLEPGLLRDDYADVCCARKGSGGGAVAWFTEREAERPVSGGSSPAPGPTLGPTPHRRSCQNVIGSRLDSLSTTERPVQD